MRQLVKLFGALVLCLVTARASAHAPLPRGLAVSPDGVGVALALPGFGLLLRTATAPGFAYACDAVLGIPPSDAPPAVQYFADGSWLVASSGGLHTLDADGCELSPPHVALGRAPISAIAIHGASQVAYAVATELGEGVWRSEDLGASWQLRGAIDDSADVNALLVDADDPARLYVSRGASDADAALTVSSDAGATFEVFPQTRALRLLAVQDAGQLWAVARALDHKANRGFDILHADAAGALWQSRLRVNFFGGLTITDNGEIWVGDEGGGVYRSTDRGASFAWVESPRSISCIASSGNEVWACTPDLPSAPALNVLAAAAASFEPALALADVDAQVTCAQHNQGVDPCQAAWVEWQRDVIGRVPVLAEPPVDASQPLPESTPPMQPTELQPSAASCALTAHPHGAASHWALLLLCAAWRRARRAAFVGAR